MPLDESILCPYRNLKTTGFLSDSNLCISTTVLNTYRTNIQYVNACSLFYSSVCLFKCNLSKGPHSFTYLLKAYEGIVHCLKVVGCLMTLLSTLNQGRQSPANAKKKKKNSRDNKSTVDH